MAIAKGLLSEDDYLLQEILFNPRTPGQVTNIRTELKNLLEIIENKEMCIRDRKERILIYGDYDVDGTTAVALVYKFIQQFYSNLDYYIPDRYNEG